MLFLNLNTEEGIIVNGNRNEMKILSSNTSNIEAELLRLLGKVAKQPNTNTRIRLMAIQQRMIDEAAKDHEESLRNNQRDILRSKFHKSTDKKCLETKIRNEVKKSLQAADDDLNCKRERLRSLLLSEEREYMREVVSMAQQVAANVAEQQRLKALEVKVRRKAEDAAMAAEKRMQQYMNRCEELRTFREALNTKEVAQAVLKQIEDKQKQREADKEMEKMWEDVARKNYALMVAYEEEESHKRKNRMKEINDILQNQIKGLQLYKNEEERLKMEERANLQKEREHLVLEEELAKREAELKKRKMFEEMKAVNRQSVELHERRKAQEKVLNDMFCQLIQEELKKEQEQVKDNKSQLRKESELFRAYLEEMKQQRKRQEEETDELRVKEMAKIDAKQLEADVKKCEAVLKLREAVLRERCLQMKAKEKEKEEEKRKELEEARLAELLRLEHLKLEEEEKRVKNKEQKEYRMDLAKQIEDNKLTLMKQCEEEEKQLRESILKEETYFNKVKDIIANQCSSETHPFMKKLQGMAV